MLVSTTGLTKRYGAFTALDGCTLGVAEGETFGLLGPNGAGKTTLLRLLLGFITPTAGTASVAGHDCVRDPVRVRAATAYLPGEARLFRRMTGHEVLDFFARLRPGCDRQRATTLARRLDLDCGRQVARMSTGMRQKLALATVLATDARLMILDEPTANLDPTARAEVLELVRECRAAGRTVIFSSHVLSEVEASCDRVAIVRAGRLVHEQSLEQVRRRHRITVRLQGPFAGLPAGVPIASGGGRGGITVRDGGDGVVVLDDVDELAPLLGWLSTVPLTEIRIEPVGLDAIYDAFHRPAAAGRPAAVA
ncbi:MAG: ABC transporter ATP-binding protein [Planctomycetia bacterium]|nr:ABC transporter ATP-binding protein [Planctomycetia bacterium]